GYGPSRKIGDRFQGRSERDREGEVALHETVTREHQREYVDALDHPREHQPALQRLGEIVRAADVKGQEGVAPEGAGLRAIAQGLAAMEPSDKERLRIGFHVYDALYAYVGGKVGQLTR